MNARETRLYKGFTLIELLVVISIIGILALGILSAVYNARIESRDLARVSDIQQLRLAVKLYQEAKGTYPTSSGVIGIGGAIDIDLAPFLTKINRDPLSDGTGDGYAYVYNSNFTCIKSGQAVVYARQVEQHTKHNNFAVVCTGASGADLSTYQNAYIEIVNPR
jgi:prepilin-type N-terminal cleavage/methylation domain-containing protein